MTSPPGGSTLTTSAPWSASTIVASGPDMFIVRSTTRKPASGPVRGSMPGNVGASGKSCEAETLERNVEILSCPPVAVAEEVKDDQARSDDQQSPVVGMVVERDAQAQRGPNRRLDQLHGRRIERDTARKVRLTRLECCGNH